MAGFAVGQARPGVFEDASPVQFDAAPVPFWGQVTRAVGPNIEDATQTRMAGKRDEDLAAGLWERHRAMEKALGAKLPLSESLTGEPTADREGLQRVLEAVIPADRINATLLGRPGVLTDDAYEASIADLRLKHPGKLDGVQSRDEILAAIQQRLTGIRRNAEAKSQGPGGMVGAFAGQTIGAMMDPRQLGVAIVTGPAGAGKPLATRMLAQFGVNAEAQALASGELMDEAARIGGPAYGAQEAALDVFTAGVGGAGFEAAGAGVRAGWRAMRGKTADPAIRGAIDVADVGARDDAILGPVDGAAHEEGLDALVRGAPRPAVEPAQELGDLFGDAPVATAAPGITGEADYRGRRILQGNFDPREIGVDPQRFQYKADGDSAGVTARLKGVEAWDPTASGKVIIFESRDGVRVIADGHQRRGLALRLDAEGFEPRLDGYLFREADGWTSKQVRTVAALKNIREGSGQILDAAKVFRDAPEALNDRSLPMTGDFMTQARALARLNPEAFGAVINKVIPERYGAEIGAMAADRPDLHDGLVRLLKDGEPANLDEARALVSEGLLDDWIAREGEQGNLFGNLPAQSTTIARAKVKNAVLSALRKDARTFGALVKNADAIEAGGNVLLRDANETAAVVSRTALEVLSRLSLRAGEVGDAMAEAAIKVTGGVRPADAAKGLIAMVRNRIAAGEALEGIRLSTLDPSAPSPAARDLVAGFDDPTGPAVKAQGAAAPEDAAFEAEGPPGLFDDLPPVGAEDRAHARLIACAPGE